MTGVQTCALPINDTAYEIVKSDWSSDVCSSDLQQMAPVKDASSEDTQDADTREDTGSTAKPDDADSTPDQQDGQTESEEDVGRNTQDQDSSDTETTREDTKDSGMTTTEEDVGAGSEACRTE